MDDRDLRLPALKAVLILTFILFVRQGQDPIAIHAGLVSMIIMISIYGLVDPAGRIYEWRMRRRGLNRR